MFSLLIAVISLALVAGLALATLYYGGASFNQASTNVRTSQLLSEAQQVQGAVDLFEAENHRKPTGPSELTTGGVWLKELPSDWGGGPASLSTNSSLVGADSCLLFNQKRLGINTIPFCNDPLYTNQVICCQEPPVYVTP